MRIVEHAVDIPASPATVWQVLTDTERYDEWNPFMTRLSGRLAVGERLTVTIRPGRRSMARGVLDDTELGIAEMDAALSDRARSRASGSAQA